jgi:amidohydrolase
MTDLLDEALELFEYTRGLRRDFHQHPELGFQEVRTAGIVAGELKELGLEVTTGIAQTGVVALLEGTRPGPVALLRFDMDALPVQEETGADYASRIPGSCACGRRATAIRLTVAGCCNDTARISGHGRARLPAGGGGAGRRRRMIASGVLKTPNRT